MPVNAVRFRFVSITRHFPSRDSGLSHELNPGLVEFDSIHGSMRWISPTFNDFQHKALHAVIISRILGDMGKKNEKNVTKKRRGGPGILQEYFGQISETRFVLKN